MKKFFSLVLFFGFSLAVFLLFAPKNTEAAGWIAQSYPGGSAAPCTSPQAKIDFYTYQKAAETQVSVSHILVKVMRADVTRDSAESSNSSYAGKSLCFDPYQDNLSISIDGGSSYQPMVMSWGTSTPANLVNNYIQLHAHLVPLGDNTLPASLNVPANDAWLNASPQYQVGINYTVHAASAVSKICLSINLTCVDGSWAPGAVATIPSQNLADGWYQSWNINLYDNLSRPSVTDWAANAKSFGIDTVAPLNVTANHQPNAPLPNQNVQIFGHAEDASSSTATSGLDFIQIYIDGSTQDVWKCANLNGVPLADCNPNVGGYAAGSVHNITVHACDRAGNCKDATGSFTVQSPPGQSGSLTAPVTCGGGNRPSIAFSWSAASNATEYYLEVNKLAWTGPPGTNGPSPYVIKVTSLTTFTWNNLKPLSTNDGMNAWIPENNTAYWWRVKAVNSSSGLEGAYVYPPNSLAPPGASTPPKDCAPPSPSPSTAPSTSPSTAPSTSPSTTPAPSVPTLSVGNVQCRQFTVSWTVVAGATNYQLKVSDDGGAPTTISVGNVTSWTLYGDYVYPNHTYTLQVQAYVSGVWGAWSNTVTVNTPSCPANSNPTPLPEAIICSADGNSFSVTLSWIPASGAVGYDLQMTTDPTFVTIPGSYNVNNTSQTNYTFSNLAFYNPGTGALYNYYWRVRGNIPFQPLGPWIYPPNTQTPPGTPFSKAGCGGTIFGFKYHLPEWQAFGSQSGEIHPGAIVTVVNVSSNQTVLVDDPTSGIYWAKPLTPGDYRVSAYGVGGQTVYAAVSNSTVAPQNGTYTQSAAGDGTSVVVTVAANNNTLPGGVGELNVWFYYQNAPSPSPSPTPPTGLTVSGLPACSSSAYTVTFSWTGTAANWTIDIDSDGNWGNGWLSSKTGVNGTSTTGPAGFNNSLVFNPGATYWWRIYYNVPNAWAYPTPVSFSVPLCPPIAGPSNLDVTVSCDAANNVPKLVFGWTDNATNETNYEIDVSTQVGWFSWGSKTLVSSSTGYTWDGSAGARLTGTPASPVNNGSYFWRVKAYDSVSGTSGAYAYYKFGPGDDPGPPGSVVSTLDCAPPANADNLSVTKFCDSPTQPKLVFGWSDNAHNETDYYLDVSTDGFSTWGFKQLAPNTTSYTWDTSASARLTGAPVSPLNNTAYYWRVRAFNSVTGIYSAHVYYQTAAPGWTLTSPGNTVTTMDCPNQGFDLVVNLVSTDGPVYASGATATMKVKVTNNGPQQFGGGGVLGFWKTVPTSGQPDCEGTPPVGATAPTDQTQPIGVLNLGQSTADMTFSFNVGISEVSAQALFYALPSCAPAGERDYNGVGHSNRLTIPWNVTVNAWFKTTAGDVGSHGDITQALNPDSQSQYVLVGSIFDHAKGAWQLTGYSQDLVAGTRPGAVYKYLAERFLGRAFDGTHTISKNIPGPPAACEVSNSNFGSANPTKDTHLRYCDGDARFQTGMIVPAGDMVLFVSGDLYIESDLALTSPNTLAFLVAGNIIVNTSVKNAGGVYIAQGNFIDTNGITSGEQLKIDGAVYAHAAQLTRKLCSTCTPGDNANFPAEVINYSPRFILRLMDILGTPGIVWREVVP